MPKPSHIILIGAALHVLAYVLTGFDPAALTFLVGAGIFALLAFVTGSGIRGANWIAFIVLLGSSAAAVSHIVAPSIVPIWVIWGILATNLAALLMLFATIWRGRNKQETV